MDKYISTDSTQNNGLNNVANHYQNKERKRMEIENDITNEFDTIVKDFKTFLYKKVHEFDPQKKNKNGMDILMKNIWFYYIFHKASKRNMIEIYKLIGIDKEI
mgnify:CR=1 FL=1|jgi:hypothetical protein